MIFISEEKIAILNYVYSPNYLLLSNFLNFSAIDKVYFYNDQLLRQ